MSGLQQGTILNGGILPVSCACPVCPCSTGFIQVNPDPHVMDLSSLYNAESQVGNLAQDVQVRGSSVMETVAQLEGKTLSESRRVVSVVKQMSAAAQVELGNVNKVQALAVGAMNSIAEIEKVARAKKASLEEEKTTADSDLEEAGKLAHAASESAAQALAAKTEATAAFKELSKMSKAAEQQSMEAIDA